jgi:hypothetical protein
MPTPNKKFPKQVWINWQVYSTALHVPKQKRMDFGHGAGLSGTVFVLSVLGLEFLQKAELMASSEYMAVVLASIPTIMAILLILFMNAVFKRDRINALAKKGLTEDRLTDVLKDIRVPLLDQLIERDALVTQSEVNGDTQMPDFFSVSTEVARARVAASAETLERSFVDHGDLGTLHQDPRAIATSPRDLIANAAERGVRQATKIEVG